MNTFRFTDDQWDQVAAEPAELGRLKNDGDRWQLEFICDHFVRLRPKLGRDRFDPIKAGKAWLRVAAAASELNEAIKGLRPAGAADFTMLDNHQGAAADWASDLSIVIDGAKWAAALETSSKEPYDRADGPNTDPMLDGFLRKLISAWQGFGGKLSTGYDDAKGEAGGPLLRFLIATTTPAMAAANEEPLTPDQVRAVVRKFKAKRKTQDMVS